MLTEKTGQLIVILLAAILGVLLFGKDGLPPWVFWCLAAFGVLALIFLIVRAIWRATVPAIAEHVTAEKEDGGSVILVLVSWLGVVGLVIVGVWSTILSMRGIPFEEGYQSIPFYWLPLVLLIGGMGANEGIKWLREKLRERKR